MIIDSFSGCTEGQKIRAVNSTVVLYNTLMCIMLYKKNIYEKFLSYH